MADKSDSGFDIFSERSRRVFEVAQEEARRFNQRYITTEHLLLALLQEKEGVAAQIFTNLEADIGEMRSNLEFMVNREVEDAEGVPSLDPRAKKAIRTAVNEARLAKLKRVGTEHLLIGLLNENDGRVVDLLHQNSITLDRVRYETRRLTTGGGGRSTKPARRSRSSRSRTPMLDHMAVDLTEMAREGKLDPVIGRDNELERVIQILSRRTKNNPVLVGDPGVGKTAIVEKLASTIIDGAGPGHP